MKKIYYKIKNYFKIIYRISANPKKFETIVWKDLLELHKEAQWKYGIYETEKYIETVFEIAPDVVRDYYYMIYSDHFHCRVKITENFDWESTTDLFVLAAHFNNLLNTGTVIINVESKYVEYHVKSDLIIHLIYTGELYNVLRRHFNISKDVYWAFNKLLNEQEEPAIIIADLIKMNDEKNATNK
jgi:hypothetical protein